MLARLWHVASSPSPASRMTLRSCIVGQHSLPAGRILARGWYDAGLGARAGLRTLASGPQSDGFRLPKASVLSQLLRGAGIRHTGSKDVLVGRLAAVFSPGGKLTKEAGLKAFKASQIGKDPAAEAEAIRLACQDLQRLLIDHGVCSKDAIGEFVASLSSAASRGRKEEHLPAQFIFADGGSKAFRELHSAEEDGSTHSVGHKVVRQRTGKSTKHRPETHSGVAIEERRTDGMMEDGIDLDSAQRFLRDNEDEPPGSGTGLQRGPRGLAGSLRSLPVSGLSAGRDPLSADGQQSSEEERPDGIKAILESPKNKRERRRFVEKKLRSQMLSLYRYPVLKRLCLLSQCRTLICRCFLSFWMHRALSCGHPADKHPLRRCLISADRCPSPDWRETMMHYVRMRCVRSLYYDFCFCKHCCAVLSLPLFPP